MGQGRYSISYDEFIVLCDDRPKLKDLLVKHRPKRGKGRPPKEDQENHSVGMNNEPARKPGNSRLYIEERLQRDHPKVWKQYLNGEFKSARQAGIAAGFITDSHDPLKRLKSNWAKATSKQKKEFLSWIEDQ
jgi:hypothetical protein